MEGGDGTKAASLIQLQSTIERARDKYQTIHLLWGSDREK